MVAEHQDRAGIVDLRVFPDELLEEDRRHRRDVLVAEPNVGEHEPFVARLHGGNADLSLRRVDDPPPGPDLFPPPPPPPRPLWGEQHAVTPWPGHVVIETNAL